MSETTTKLTKKVLYQIRILNGAQVVAIIQF